MKNLLTKIIKIISQRLFSLLWRACIPVEWLKLKLRFKNCHIRLLRKGKGEMFKFILSAPNKKPILIKKDNWLTEFWVYLNSYLHITMKPKHHNFQDKADVLETILKTELKNFTALISVDRKNKEYWQQYHKNSKDLRNSSYTDESKKIQEILNSFLSHGISSYDHMRSNFILVKKNLIAIDLESFQFVKDKNRLKK